MSQPCWPILIPNVSPTGQGPQFDGAEQAEEADKSPLGGIALTHNGSHHYHSDRPGSVGGNTDKEPFRFNP